MIKLLYGGSWHDNAQFLRTTNPNDDDTTTRGINCSFRLVKEKK